MGGTEPSHDRGVLGRDIVMAPSDRKAVSSSAFRRGGPLEGSVKKIDLATQSLARKEAGAKALLTQAFQEVVAGMDVHGYVTGSDRQRSPDWEEAAWLSESAARRFRQGYEKAAMGYLHDALACLGVYVEL